MSATPTYESIRKEIERRRESTKARDITALSKMQAELDADFDHRAELFFRDDQAFEAAVEAHVERMAARSGGPASRASRSQRRSGLRRVRTIAHELADTGDAGWETLSAAISSCRRRIGLSKRQMMIQYSSKLKDYENKKHVPREGARSALESLADAACVERDVLTRHITSRRQQTTESGQAAPSHPHYGLGALGYELPGMASTRRLDGEPKTPLPETCPLKRDLEEFIQFKTARIPPHGLVRHNKSKWTANVHGEYASVDSHMNAISQFFGFLNQILGIPPEHLTLPMIADAVLLEEYDHFLRSRGASGLSDKWLAIALMMSRRSGDAPGYVRQQRSRFGPYIYGAHGYLSSPAVRALYARRFNVDDANQRDAAGVLDALRCAHHDVDDPISLVSQNRQRHLDWCDFNAQIVASWVRNLDSDEDEYASQDGVYALIGQKVERQERPITVLRELLDALQDERSKYPDGHNDVLSLDYAMAIIAFQGSVPLREGNLRSVRLHPDLVHDDVRARLPLWRPSLYPTDDGGLFFSEHREYFKNRRALAGRRIEYFEAPIAPWAVPYVHHFITNVRPCFNGAVRGNPYLFPGKSTQDRLHIGKRGNRMAHVTEMVFGQAFRIHWFRHLVATDVLATHPEALHFVAELLQDDLETVRRMYDRSRPSDAARFAHRYQELAMA